MTSMKIVQFSRPPTHLVHLHPKFFNSLYLVHSISNDPPFPNDKQPIKRKQSKNDYYLLSGPSFRFDFVFNINSLILFGFLLTFFHLAKASLCAFPWLSTLVCAVVQKYHEMSFIYNYTHF